MVTEDDYKAYRKQERGLASQERLALWMTLPEEVRDDFRRFAHRRGMRRALWRYTIGVLFVAGAVLGGIACIAVAAVVGPRHINALVLAGVALVMLGWIPGAQMASSAKYDLVDRA